MISSFLIRHLGEIKLGLKINTVGFSIYFCGSHWAKVTITTSFPSSLNFAAVAQMVVPELQKVLCVNQPPKVELQRIRFGDQLLSYGSTKATSVHMAVCQALPNKLQNVFDLCSMNPSLLLVVTLCEHSKGIQSIQESLKEKYPKLCTLAVVRRIEALDWNGPSPGNTFIFFGEAAEKAAIGFDELCKQFKDGFEKKAIKDNLFKPKDLAKYSHVATKISEPSTANPEASTANPEASTAKPEASTANPEASAADLDASADGDELEEKGPKRKRMKLDDLVCAMQKKASENKGVCWFAPLTKVPKAPSALPTRGEVLVGLAESEVMVRKLLPAEVLRMKAWPSINVNLSYLPLNMQMEVALQSSFFLPSMAAVLASVASLTLRQHMP